MEPIKGWLMGVLEIGGVGWEVTICIIEERVKGYDAGPKPMKHIMVV
jgi:hypothetical protein